MFKCDIQYAETGILRAWKYAAKSMHRKNVCPARGIVPGCAGMQVYKAALVTGLPTPHLSFSEMG